MPKKWTDLTISQVSEIVGRFRCNETATHIGREMNLPMCRPAHIKQGRAYKSIIQYMKIEDSINGQSLPRGYEIRDTPTNTIKVCGCCDGNPCSPR